MKIVFSNVKIVPYDVWFLDNTKDFFDRKLLLGKTFNGRSVVSLVETRIADCKKYVDTQVGARAERIINNERNRVKYTRQEVLLSRKGKPYGWTYGDNREIHNKKGEVVAIRQYRSDNYGNSELVKEIKKK